MRDSGISGTGDTTRKPPPAPRKASILERKSTCSVKSNKVYENSLFKRVGYKNRMDKRKQEIKGTEVFNRLG
ncbi:hypothetical protein CWS01_19045 [Niallia nealsonii]|uniref:Uncharacterized protein n=1 Tax=Niallia nealsonii TaxID=115979 RepID=A0A2N0YXT5_9BACI|nr:hypothetical protein CWS01_19045 [Niallia nealsonii]